MLLTTAFAANVAFSRPRSFSLFLLPAGLLYFGADTDSGTAGPVANLSAIWLLCLIVVSIFAIIRVGKAGVPLAAPEIGYLVFLGWCAIESFRAADSSFAVRAFLKLLYPFLSMYLARRTVGSPDSADRLIKWQFRMTTTVTVLIFTALAIPALFVVVNFVFWGAAAFFDHAVIIAMLALACWKVRGKLRYLVLALILSAICFKAVNRTTIVALALGVSIISVLAFRKIAVVLLPILYVGLLAILFTVPAFREKMFYNPNKVQTGVLQSASAVTSGQLNNDGRFAMWNEVLRRFFWPNPAVGSGLGATQAWFYSGAAEPILHTKLKIEHSEYVKLASDTGLIGVALFVVSILLALVDAIRAYRRSTEESARIFSLAAICALPMFLFIIALDNALLYVLPVAQFPLSFAAIASRLSVSNPVAASKVGRRAMPQRRWLRRRTAGERFAGGVHASACAPAIRPV